MEVKKKPKAEIQAKGGKKGKLENKKKGTPDGRDFNPWHKTHTDIFGRGLLNKILILYLLGEGTMQGKMTRYTAYEILVGTENKKFIVMKPAIEKIAELDKRDIELVKKYAISLVKAKHGSENSSCLLYKRGCNNMLCPMLSEPGIWYSEENLCLNPGYKDNLVVINQKKLKNKHPEGYFTRDMLSKRFVIKSGISGIDPDVPPSIDGGGQAAVDNLYIKREKEWNEAHQQISKATREKRKTHT